MHFVILVPASAIGIVLFCVFLVWLAEAAPKFVGALVLIILVTSAAGIITALRLWNSTAAIFAIILAFLAFGLFLRVLSNSWSRMLGHPSKETHLAAAALADLKNAEARADLAALKAQKKSRQFKPKALLQGTAHGPRKRRQSVMSGL